MDAQCPACLPNALRDAQEVWLLASCQDFLLCCPCSSGATAHVHDDRSPGIHQRPLANYRRCQLASAKQHERLPSSKLLGGHSVQSARLMQLGQTTSCRLADDLPGHARLPMSLCGPFGLALKDSLLHRVACRAVGDEEKQCCFVCMGVCASSKWRARWPVHAAWLLAVVRQQQGRGGGTQRSRGGRDRIPASAKSGST